MVFFILVFKYFAEWRKGSAFHIDITLQCHDSRVSDWRRQCGDYYPGIWQCAGL